MPDDTTLQHYWFAVDPTWSALGYATLESYLQTWVPQPSFHALVPEDVHKAYRTTCYLFANAWHHYPMYDQGLQHLLGTMEMSVKMRAEQLAITLSSTAKQGKSGVPTLNNLIEQVCQHHQARDLKQKLHWARKIRNYHAHPERYSYAPVMMLQAVVPLLNLLNELFIEPSLATQTEQYLTTLNEQLHSLQNTLLILEHKGLRYLVHQAQPLRTFNTIGQWRTIWVFYPVLPKAQQALSQHHYLRPIVLCLSAIGITDGGLVAQEVGSNQIVRVLVNKDPRNQPVWAAHQQAWEQASRIDQWMFSSSQQSDVLSAQNKLEHQFGWGYTPTEVYHPSLTNA